MSKSNTAPQYNADDMLDLATLASEQIEWLSIGLSDIRKELINLKAELTKRDVNNQYKFYVLEKKIEIFEYLSQDQQEVCKREIAKYTLENNGGDA